jgi:hypothetical protein
LEGLASSLIALRGKGGWLTMEMEGVAISMGARRDTKAAISLAVGTRRGDGTTIIVWTLDKSCTSMARDTMAQHWQGKGPLLLFARPAGINLSLGVWLSTWVLASRLATWFLATRLSKRVLREWLGGDCFPLLPALTWILSQQDAGELDGHVRCEGPDLVQGLEIIDGLDLQAGHGHQEELDILRFGRVDLAVGGPQEDMEVPVNRGSFP